MATSIFLAKLFGIVLLAKAFVIVLKRKEIPQIVVECFNNKGIVYTVAAIEFIASLSILLNHNIWEGWPAIITILGWIMLIDSSMALILPFNKIKSLLYAINTPKFYVVGVIIALVLGIFLTTKGFSY